MWQNIMKLTRISTSSVLLLFLLQTYYRLSCHDLKNFIQELLIVKVCTHKNKKIKKLSLTFKFQLVYINLPYRIMLSFFEDQEINKIPNSVLNLLIIQVIFEQVNKDRSQNDPPTKIYYISQLLPFFLPLHET